MKLRLGLIQKGACLLATTAFSVATITTALVTSTASVNASVQNTPSNAAIKQQLASVPRAELAAKAASMVVAAQGQDRNNLAELIVATAIDMHPTATTAIVGSIAKLSPDVAALVATKAASKQPKLIGAIARAAAAAAPAKSLDVVESLCKQSPTEYRDIALGVAQAVPGTDRSILGSVTAAVPPLKVFLTRATEMLESQGALTVDQTVPMVLNQVGRDLKQAAPALKTTVPVLVAQGVPQAQYAAMPPSPLPPKKDVNNPRLRPPFTPRKDGNDKIPPMTRDDTVVSNPAGPRNYSTP